MTLTISAHPTSPLTDARAAARSRTAARARVTVRPYTGTGFPCRRSWTCTFRIQPASGDAQDLREAARLRLAHERQCRFTILGDPRSSPRQMTNLDERATVAAERDIDEEMAFERRFPDTALKPFRCRCIVCKELFDATGPRSQYCPKVTCQQMRKVPLK